MKKKSKYLMSILTFVIVLMFTGEIRADVGVGFPHDTCISDINGEVNIQEGNCADSQTFMGVMEQFVGGLMGLSGSIAVALIVYGGFKYIMAAGNPKEVENAKNIIFYAGLGLFVTLSSFLILSMVFEALSK